MSYARAASALAEAKRIAITSHINPDGDGIGAALALALGLKQLGKRCQVILPSQPASLYGFLPGFGSCTVLEDDAAAKRKQAVDVLVSVDCGDRQRLGAVAALRNNCSINIDHHASNDRFADINIVKVTTACTCQMIDSLLSRMGVSCTADMATCLYAGLVFDTGRFMHSNTTSSEFRFAAKLLRTGIDAAWINRQLTYTRSEHDLAIEALGIKRLERDQDQRLAGIALSAKDIAAVGAPEDWGDLVDVPRSLAGVEIAYLMREQQDGSVRCSLRSNPPYVVGTVAEAFGGGGHLQAAGCTLTGGIRKAKAALQAALRQQLH